MNSSNDNKKKDKQNKANPNKQNNNKARATTNMNDFKAYKSVITRLFIIKKNIYIYICKIELKYIPSDNLALKATTEGRAGRVSGALLNFSVSAGRVTCEDGGSYQCKITHTGANNESLTVTSASVNVAVVGKAQTFYFFYWRNVEIVMCK